MSERTLKWRIVESQKKFLFFSVGPFSAIASCTTPPSSPSAVVLLKATTTANSVHVTWKEPPNNGSDILSYNIDLGEKHLIAVGNVLEYTIDDLLPETTYK